MGKYSNEELSEMAGVVLAAHDSGDIRALHLILSVSVLTDTDPIVVLRHIGELSDGVADRSRW